MLASKEIEIEDETQETIVEMPDVFKEFGQKSSANFANYALEIESVAPETLKDYVQL